MSLFDRLVAMVCRNTSARPAQCRTRSLCWTISAHTRRTRLCRLPHPAHSHPARVRVAGLVSHWSSTTDKQTKHSHARLYIWRMHVSSHACMHSLLERGSHVLERRLELREARMAYIDKNGCLLRVSDAKCKLGHAACTLTRLVHTLGTHKQAAVRAVSLK